MMALFSLFSYFFLLIKREEVVTIPSYITCAHNYCKGSGIWTRALFSLRRCNVITWQVTLLLSRTSLVFDKNLLPYWGDYCFRRVWKGFGPRCCFYLCGKGTRESSWIKPCAPFFSWFQTPVLEINR